LKKCNAGGGKRFIFSKASCVFKMFFPWYPLGITNSWKRKENLIVVFVHLVQPTDQGITKIGESPGSRLRVPYSINPLSRALPSTKKGFQVSRVPLYRGTPSHWRFKSGGKWLWPWKVLWKFWSGGMESVQHVTQSLAQGSSEACPSSVAAIVCDVRLPVVCSSDLVRFRIFRCLLQRSVCDLAALQRHGGALECHGSVICSFWCLRLG